MNPHRTPWHDLLAIAALVPGPPDPLRDAAREVTDWTALFAIAEHHGLATTLFTALERAGVAHPVARRAAAAAFVRAVRHRDAVRDLGIALATIEAAGVTVAPIKGPLLSERLYDPPYARPSVDLDLLVGEGQIDRACAALATLGYRADDDGAARRAAGSHHVAMWHATGPLIEVHFDAHVGLGVTLGAAPFLDRATRRAVAALDVAVLAPADEIVYVGVHAASHRFGRLAWLYDLKLLARAHPDAVGLALVRAREMGVHRAVVMALHLARRWVDADLGAVAPRPDAIARAARPLVAIGARSPRVESAVLFATTVLLCDSPRGTATYLAKKIARDLPRRLRR